MLCFFSGFCVLDEGEWGENGQMPMPGPCGSFHSTILRYTTSIRSSLYTGTDPVGHATPTSPAVAQPEHAASQPQPQPQDKPHGALSAEAQKTAATLGSLRESVEKATARLQDLQQSVHSEVLQVLNDDSPDDAGADANEGDG